jgi:acetylornithine deacetylase/succinyl-diaminopimelate desuccinylase-like protein
MDPALSLLKDLVAIDSVNPSLVTGGAGEREIAVFIGDWLRRGTDVDVDEVLLAAGTPWASPKASRAGRPACCAATPIPSAWRA